MYTSIELKTKDSIYKFMEQHIMLFGSFDNVYLFGSILNMNSIPNDIDILLIYTEYSSEIINDINCIRTMLARISGLPVDLTVLSVEEEKDTEFLQKITPLYLKLK